MGFFVCFLVSLLQTLHLLIKPSRLPHLNAAKARIRMWYIVSLGLQIAQSRSYLHTLGPKVGIIYILGALGFFVYDMYDVSQHKDGSGPKAQDREDPFVYGIWGP